MSEIVRYLGRMLVLAVPAAMVTACFYPYRKRALQGMGLRTSLRHEIGLLLLVMSVSGILAVTLRPVCYWESSPGLWGDLLLCIDRPNAMYNVNLVPFRMFVDYWEDFQYHDGFFTVLNFFGNLCVFVPVGLLPALIFPKQSWKQTALRGFGLSLLIECGQYFLGRASDIDDVILNTAGALCGYGLLRLWERWQPRLVNSFRCAPVENFSQKSETNGTSQSSNII